MKVDLSRIQKRGLIVAHKKKLLTLFFISFGILATSCARTVTDRNTALFLEIKLTTRGAINPSQFNYFFIFSKSASPLIALPDVNPGSNYYFPTPGRTFDTEDPIFSELFNDEGITPYYENYFSTWSDYIAIQGGKLLLYKSNATQFEATTTDNNKYTYSRNRLDASYTIIGNTLTMTIDASTIYPLLSGTAYFKIATTKISDDTETGYFRDKIDVEATLPIQIHQKNGPNSEIEHSGLDSASDIVSWEARLF